MSVQVLFPKIGFAMSEGTLSEWLVPDGSPVQAGQVIYSIESDKSVEEVESPAGGTIRIIAPPGAIYQVGAVLATIS